jgi:hypothetical protein
MWKIGAMNSAPPTITAIAYSGMKQKMISAHSTCSSRLL